MGAFPGKSMAPSTRRDDFPADVKDILAKRAGMRCSNPNCRKPTSGPRDDPRKAVNIGVAAHITAAAPRGPRHDGSMSPEKRRSIENGIWLCQNCAKLVDNDAGHYTSEMLERWKGQAEGTARETLEGSAAGSRKVWRVPWSRNPLFTGREEVLRSLADNFGAGGSASRCQVLIGLGGVGKTQLAVDGKSGTGNPRRLPISDAIRRSRLTSRGRGLDRAAKGSDLRTAG